MLDWCSWKSYSLAYFSTPAPLCLVGFRPWLDPHFLVFLMVYPETLGFEPDLIFFIQILFWVLSILLQAPDSRCGFVLPRWSPQHMPVLSHTWLKDCLTKAKQNTLYRFSSSFQKQSFFITENLFSKLLSMLSVSSQVSSGMIPAVSLDSLGPGLRQKLGGMDQGSESGRVGSTKANTYSRCRSRSSVLAIWGLAWGRICVCDCAMGRLYHGRKGVICYPFMIFCSGLAISDFRVVATTAEFNKFVESDFKMVVTVVPQCL